MNRSELIDAILKATKTTYNVIAYDESGYGENCSREFSDQDEAVAYARSLDKRFGATVWEQTTNTFRHNVKLEF